MLHISWYWYCGQLDPPVLTAPFTPGDCLIESGRKVGSASTPGGCLKKSQKQSQKVSKNLKKDLKNTLKSLKNNLKNLKQSNIFSFAPISDKF